MPKNHVCAWALAAALVSPLVQTRGASFADSIVSYTSGTGFAPGFTDPNSALGEPSRITPGQFGGPVDPFDPPFLAGQLVSVGAGGSLTLGFSTPIVNDPTHPYGLDFVIFGNSGFQIVNGDYSGGGITDGSLFGAAEGATRVSVSSDGVAFYTLSPSLAPVVDGPFPTDGSGNFSTPLNPSLTTGSFAGKDMAGIRQLYQGSAGGTAYDIAWARNSAGQAVDLSSIRFVRVDVLSGVSEIDGISAVAAVPEPEVIVLLAGGLAVMYGCRRRS